MVVVSDPPPETTAKVTVTPDTPPPRPSRTTTEGENVGASVAPADPVLVNETGVGTIDAALPAVAVGRTTLTGVVAKVAVPSPS